MNTARDTPRSRKKLSPWFPPDVKPVHVGWYQATIFPDKMLPPMFVWNGLQWWNESAQRPVMNQNRYWRGLKRKP